MDEYSKCHNGIARLNPKELKEAVHKIKDQMSKGIPVADEDRMRNAIYQCDYNGITKSNIESIRGAVNANLDTLVPKSVIDNICKNNSDEASFSLIADEIRKVL